MSESSPLNLNFNTIVIYKLFYNKQQKQRFGLLFFRKTRWNICEKSTVKMDSFERGWSYAMRYVCLLQDSLRLVQTVRNVSSCVFPHARICHSRFVCTFVPVDSFLSSLLSHSMNCDVTNYSYSSNCAAVWKRQLYSVSIEFHVFRCHFL